MYFHLPVIRNSCKSVPRRIRCAEFIPRDFLFGVANPRGDLRNRGKHVSPSARWMSRNIKYVKRDLSKCNLDPASACNRGSLEDFSIFDRQTCGNLSFRNDGHMHRKCVVSAMSNIASLFLPSGCFGDNREMERSRYSAEFSAFPSNLSSKSSCNFIALCSDKHDSNVHWIQCGKFSNRTHILLHVSIDI